MKIHKIKVTFDMAFNGESGEIKATVSFDLPEHPDTPCPESVKPLLMEEIHLLSGAAFAARNQLFKDETKPEEGK